MGHFIDTCINTEEIYYSLQQQKVKSIEHSTTITELVVAWSLVVARCTSVAKSKAVLLYNTSRFLHISIACV